MLPEVNGIGSVGQTLACLEMLAQVYNVPFRQDVIERAAKDSLQDREINLETLDLATILGFIGTISVIPSAQLPRLSFPCFAVVDGELAMLHDISRGLVKAVFPEYGRVTIPLSSLSRSAWCVSCLLPLAEIPSNGSSALVGFFPRSVNIAEA